MQLDQLIASLTQIILENSGAKKVVLLLLQENTWQVRAITSAVLLIDAQAGGRCLTTSRYASTHLSQDGYVEGALELVAEIAASSATVDLGDKKRAYRRNGIQEYFVWQVFEQRIDWFHLEAGEYINLHSDAAGVIQSRVFPGLWLDQSALLSGDMQQVLSVLQTGVNSIEHQAFVQQLAQAVQSDG
ncbi:MAG: Uma2 family endonuclease [Nostoc sp.]|uniref:Uma2 family endonuclease n=1 Tax=unclassified Nostoc TaxID=2593658 RepID=UPI0025FA25C9|nr:Uma2 family endonuclease [Nostoc sp. JL33]MBN3871485.1 Uma2 family endonuclease [Nostoc sp. JL33]